MSARHLLLLPLAAAAFWACQKPVEPLPANTETTTTPPQASSTTTSGPRLSYGDTLFFRRNQPGDYTVLPVSKPSVNGVFKAIPRGLSLDSVTGRINVTQSESGMRYKVFYVAGGMAVDSVKIVLSGIDYRDAIYEIARTPAAYDTAFPIYNARPDLPLPCGDDDEDDDGDLDDDDNQCVFDETDLNDDGNDDIPGVIQDKLLVDIKKGTIDVEASFHAGIFGSSNPANGVFRDFTFYYRLQDASNRALNRITVRVYHYRRRSDIPQSLLNTMNRRNDITTNVNMRTESSLDFYAGPKRPPIIIIISQ